MLGRLPCGQLNGLTFPYLHHSKLVILRISKFPHSPKCADLSRFHDLQATTFSFGCTHSKYLTKTRVARSLIVFWTTKCCTPFVLPDGNTESPARVIVVLPTNPLALALKSRSQLSHLVRYNLASISVLEGFHALSGRRNRYRPTRQLTEYDFECPSSNIAQLLQTKHNDLPLLRCPESTGAGTLRITLLSSLYSDVSYGG